MTDPTIPSTATIPPATKPPVTPASPAPVNPISPAPNSMVVKAPDDASNKYNTSTGQLNPNYKDPNATSGIPTPSPNSNPTTNNNGGGVDALGNPISTDQANVKANQAALDASNAASIKAQQDFSNSILNLQNGAIPLNAAEQAQVDGLKAQYQSLINLQTQNNNQAQGAATSSAFRGGAGVGSDVTNNINAVVSAGVSKLNELQTEQAGAVAQLTQALRDGDISAIKTSYDSFTATQKATQDKLQQTITDTTKAITDAQAAQQKIKDSVNAIAEDLQKAGAPQDVVQNALNSGSVADALANSGNYLESSTNPDIAKYLQYKKDAQQEGLTPLDFNGYTDQQNAKDAKLKASEAYSTGYNSEAGKAAADAATGGYNGTSAKEQQAMEKTFITTLKTENSSRSGAYGINNNKVSQANKLASLFNQSYDPKTGNYNLASSQYGELAIGLASLISGTSSPSDSSIADLKTATAKGDWNKVYSYVTGSPANGSTQDIINLLASSVQREAQQASADRDAAKAQIEGQAPTDLDPSRISKLTAADGIQYIGIKGVAKKEVDSYVKQNPEQADSIAKAYEIPGMTDDKVWAYIQQLNNNNQ